MSIKIFNYSPHLEADETIEITNKLIQDSLSVLVENDETEIKVSLESTFEDTVMCNIMISSGNKTYFSNSSSNDLEDSIEKAVNNIKFQMKDKKI